MARLVALALVLATCDAFMAPVSPKAALVSRQSTIGGWEKDYYSTVNVDPAQLDAAFISANGAALDAKIAAAAQGTGVSPADAKTKLVEAFGDIGILNTDVKKLKDILSPPKKD
mmetsp:Transcript_12486/g.39646  ORF Transcript_12486/g.39646 Transcript_12486/m.39646 type:complete len:114 (-) Transcript_12486:406-747(-)